MRALVQRVRKASVTVDDEQIGQIAQGLLVLLGVHGDDTADDAEWLARKCAHLRIFADSSGHMNQSVLDIAGEALVVPQFTLYGDAVSSGNRPSFSAAAAPKPAETLYDHFAEALSKQMPSPVATGRFGAMMQVHLVNDGPVTLIMDRGGGT